MKKFQNSVVSVLLFSFLFLAMHDFAMMKIDSCNHYEMSSTKSSLNLADDIHENIHTLFAIAIDEKLHIPYVLTTLKPNLNIFLISSNYNNVLERPPLS